MDYGSWFESNTTEGPRQSTYPFAFCSPEDGKRSNFQNAVILISSDDGQSPKNISCGEYVTPSSEHVKLKINVIMFMMSRKVVMHFVNSLPVEQFPL
jgi:hypothetical protein